ncbi:hypothetical protein D3C84_1187060 [compost metagenome]
MELGLPLSITAGTITANGRIVLLSQAGHVLVSNDDGASFELQPESALAPVAAAQSIGTASLLLAGTRGVRLLAIE